MNPKQQVSHGMSKEMRDIMEEYVLLMARIAPGAVLFWCL